LSTAHKTESCFYNNYNIDNDDDKINENIYVMSWKKLQRHSLTHINKSMQAKSFMQRWNIQHWILCCYVAMLPRKLLCCYTIHAQTQIYEANNRRACLTKYSHILYYSQAVVCCTTQKFIDRWLEISHSSHTYYDSRIFMRLIPDGRNEKKKTFFPTLLIHNLVRFRIYNRSAAHSRRSLTEHRKNIIKYFVYQIPYRGEWKENIFWFWFLRFDRNKKKEKLLNLNYTRKRVEKINK
jgi:hypothetical protein